MNGELDGQKVVVVQYDVLYGLLLGGLRKTVKNLGQDTRCPRSRGRSSSPGWGKNILVSMSSRPVLEPTQPPIQWFPGVKQPGRGADHSPPTIAKIKNTWIYTSTLPIRLHCMVLN
jgi:hypothetical protein